MRKRRCDIIRRVICFLSMIILGKGIIICQNQRDFLSTLSNDISNLYLKESNFEFNENNIQRNINAQKELTFGIFKQEDTLKNTDKSKNNYSLAISSEIGLARYGIGTKNYSGWYFDIGIDLPIGKNWSVQLKYTGIYSTVFRKYDGYNYGHEWMTLLAYKWDIENWFLRGSFGFGRYFAKSGTDDYIHSPAFLALGMNIGYDISKIISLSLGLRRFQYMFYFDDGAGFIGFNTEIKI